MEIVTVVGLVPGSLELRFWLKALVVARFGVEPAIQADIKIASALRAFGFSAEELVKFNFPIAKCAYFHSDFSLMILLMIPINDVLCKYEVPVAVLICIRD